MDWLFLPESYLAAATNGRVFLDKLGEFSKIREQLLPCYPEDVRLKKIAARAAVMAQSGQYNYARCMKRGETVAAQLALDEFLKAAISIIYLLNKKYMPFYKWMYRGMCEFSILKEAVALIKPLAELDCQRQAWSEKTVLLPINNEDQKVLLIEEICSLVVEELKEQGLTKNEDIFLENHTQEICSHIEDEKIRNLHV